MALDDLALALQLQNYNVAIDAIREEEYPTLQGQTYLDHAGTTLYAKSLVENVSADLIANTFGNPHSDHAPSRLASARVEEVRRKTLEFFNADPEHFDLIFVANASAAIRLVSDCFRDAAADSKKGFWFGVHKDCHTSVVGIREAAGRGSHHCFSSDKEVSQWIAGENVGSSREFKDCGRKQLGLFAYAGQSNMTGRRLPLHWPGKIRQRQGPKIYTLLDAAALATTAPLNFGNHESAPDFTAVSFYKIFGYPDLGGLIVRKASSDVLLQRKCFYGGTVDMVITLDKTWHALKDSSLHDRLEDGTLPFHSIITLGHAIDTHIRLYGSMKKISQHTAFLSRLLYENLAAMKHSNGQDVCVIYNDESATYGNARTQGATVAFNIMAPDGSMIGYTDVERLADQHNISVRSGSLCNPGGFAQYLGWTAEEMEQAYAFGHRCSNATQIIHGKATGVVRASLGAMSNLADIQRLLTFITDNYVDVLVAGSADAQSIANTALSSRGSNEVEKTARVDMSDVRSKRPSVKRWSRRMSSFISPKQMMRAGPHMMTVA